MFDRTEVNVKGIIQVRVDKIGTESVHVLHDQP